MNFSGNDFFAAAARRVAQLDTSFALGAGELEPAQPLPPGRASFPLERLELLQELEQQSRAEKQTHDHEYFRQCVALERFAQIELAERRSNPDVLSPLGDLFMTVLFAPYDREEARFTRLHAMLDALPIYLAEAATTFGAPDPLWLSIANDVAEGFPDLLGAIGEAAVGKTGAALQESIKKTSEKTRGALKDFTRKLKELKPGGSVRVLGRDKFDELLRLKGLPYNGRELSELGDELFAKLREERHARAKKLTLFGDERAAAKALREHAPATFEEALLDIRSLVRQCRDFVYERELVREETDEAVTIIETPAFARPLIPFAAILVPKPLWSLQRSTYYVTRPSEISDLHYADLHNVVPHEAYPGHHLQFVAANRRGALVRNLPWTQAQSAAMGIDTVEGWGHYCEALMHEHGFRRSPRDDYQFTSDALWRAARIRIDCGLATGTMSLDAAMTLLADDVGLSKEGAKAEVHRYTQQPGYNSCYALGKHIIQELHKDCDRAWGNKFSLPRFHELITTNGSAPLSLCRARMNE